MASLRIKGRAVSFLDLEAYFIECQLNIPFRDSMMLCSRHSCRMEKQVNEDGECNQLSIWLSISTDGWLHLFKETEQEIVPPFFSARSSLISLQPAFLDSSILLVVEVKTFIFITEKKHILLSFDSSHEQRQFTRKLQAAQDSKMADS